MEFYGSLATLKVRLLKQEIPNSLSEVDDFTSHPPCSED